jgi:uncharacterized C2H2 Zn-finger protein
MERFRDKLMRFMAGRYGVDQLYYALMVLCLVLMLGNAFLQLPVLSAVLWVVLVLMMYRSLSRNIYKRQIENQTFLKLWNPIKSTFSLLGKKLRDIKTHRYHKCPNCKVVLRLPRKKGKHTVKCPRCQTKFQVNVRL